ncbi:MAG: hypothetical protein AB8G23_06110 [Myxococcota bacterium]
MRKHFTHRPHRPLLLVPLMLCAFAAHAEEYDPLQVAKDDFFGVVQTIAIWPISMPFNIADTAEGKAEIGSLIESKMTEQLESQGFRVVPSDVITQRWTAAAEAMGGFVDPITGEGNQEAIDLARSLLRTELAIRDGVDATFSPRLTAGSLSVWAQKVEYLEEDGHPNRTYTSWMAGREAIRWQGGPLHSRWLNRPTRVIGHRLGVRIHNTAGVELYNVMVPIRYTDVYVRGGRESREETPFLSHKEELNKAIDLLLESLQDPSESE